MPTQFNAGQVRFDQAGAANVLDQTEKVGAARAGVVAAVGGALRQKQLEREKAHREKQLQDQQASAKKRAGQLLSEGRTTQKVRMGEFTPFAAVVMTGSEEEAAKRLGTTLGLDPDAAAAMARDMRREVEVEVMDPVMAAAAIESLVAGGMELDMAKEIVREQAGEAYAGANGLREAMSKQAQDATQLYFKTKDPSLMQRMAAERENERVEFERKSQTLGLLEQLSQQPGMVDTTSQADVVPEFITVQQWRDQVSADNDDFPALVEAGGLDSLEDAIQGSSAQLQMLESMTPDQRRQMGTQKHSLALAGLAQSLESMRSVYGRAQERAITLAYEEQREDPEFSTKYPTLRSFARALSQAESVEVRTPSPRLRSEIAHASMLTEEPLDRLNEMLGLEGGVFRDVERVSNVSRGPSTQINVSTGDALGQAEMQFAQGQARRMAEGERAAVTLPAPKNAPDLVNGGTPAEARLANSQKLLADANASVVWQDGRFVIDLGKKDRAPYLGDIRDVERALNQAGSAQQVELIARILTGKDTPSQADKQRAYQVWQAQMGAALRPVEEESGDGVSLSDRFRAAVR